VQSYSSTSASTCSKCRSLYVAGLQMEMQDTVVNFATALSEISCPADSARAGGGSDPPRPWLQPDRDLSQPSILDPVQVSSHCLKLDCYRKPILDVCCTSLLTHWWVQDLGFRMYRTWTDATRHHKAGSECLRSHLTWQWRIYYKLYTDLPSSVTDDSIPMPIIIPNPKS
jgi:hypothetical protein